MLENSEKLNNQAVHLASKGEYEDAIACLKRAITVENSNYLLWFNLGLTYHDAGNISLAKAAMEHAYRINPYDKTHWTALLHFVFLQRHSMRQFCTVQKALNLIR